MRTTTVLPIIARASGTMVDTGTNERSTSDSLLEPEGADLNNNYNTLFSYVCRR